MNLKEKYNTKLFKRYCLTGNKILDLIKNQSGNANDIASNYWLEELADLIMFDASPLIIEKLREHCYHLTGIHLYLRSHHNKQKEILIKYSQLKKR